MANLQDNKNTVVDFYRRSFDGDPERAVARHVGEHHTQHNPRRRTAPAPSSAW